MRNDRSKRMLLAAFCVSTFACVAPLVLAATEADLQNAKSSFYTGVDAYNRNDFPEAEKWFRKSFETVPDANTAYYLSVSLSVLRSVDEAERYARQALSLTPPLEPRHATHAREIINWAEKERAKERAALQNVSPEMRGRFDWRAGPPPSVGAPMPRRMTSDSQQARPKTPKGYSSEGECHNNVQDRIAWDYNGNKHWASANLATLCKGVSKPLEPGKCFQQVMHGNINWGGGTRWEWKNALELCGGTDNAGRRIRCFRGEVSEGKGWSDAIASCRACDLSIRVPRGATCKNFYAQRGKWDLNTIRGCGPFQVRRYKEALSIHSDLEWSQFLSYCRK